LSKQSRQEKKDVENLLPSNKKHLKYLAALKKDLKRNPTGTKLRRKDRFKNGK
tara:strand:- start:7095 stop:7253 length:159 start_codon:yes stop_codon:yes gene_type:complete